MATMPCRVLQVRSFALAYTCNTCHVFSFLSFLGPHRALARIALLMTSPQRPPKQPLPRSSPSHARPRQNGYGGQRFLFVCPQDASAPTAPEVRSHNFPLSVRRTGPYIRTRSVTACWRTPIPTVSSELPIGKTARCVLQLLLNGHAVTPHPTL